MSSTAGCVNIEEDRKQEAVARKQEAGYRLLNYATSRFVYPFKILLLQSVERAIHQQTAS
jgi:hypothetical protein